jgi:hypothetical protein
MHRVSGIAGGTISSRTYFGIDAGSSVGPLQAPAASARRTRPGVDAETSHNPLDLAHVFRNVRRASVPDGLLLPSISVIPPD